MKCPKCGYLGFETTDRCRNCQYDFSLAPSTAEQELTLHGTDSRTEPAADFDLPPLKRQTDRLSATALDLDRLFGEPEQSLRSASQPVSLPDAVETPLKVEESFEDPIATDLVADSAPAVEEPDPIIQLPEPEPAITMAVEPEPPSPPPSPVEPPIDLMIEPPIDTAVAGANDDAALPFDDAPFVPPVARPPLAVRRSTPEVPRKRPRTTRPVRTEPLHLEPQSAPKSLSTAAAATETVASLMESPSLAVRLGAGLIDLLLLVAIDAAVLYLTLRVTGLQNTLEDLLVLPPIPFVGFLALLGFGYVAAFTVAGGQTIGKMALSLRVIGDDGRPVDAAGGMLRALGCMLVPLTLGLSYLPALFTSDHRALHDRLAGTRVVQE